MPDIYNNSIVNSYDAKFINPTDPAASFSIYPDSSSFACFFHNTE